MKIIKNNEKSETFCTSENLETSTNLINNLVSHADNPIFYNPLKIYSNISGNDSITQYKNENYIKFLKFLPNNQELLVITNENRIQLLKFYLEERDKSNLETIKDKMSSYEIDIKNQPQNPNFRIKLKEILNTKESNYIYDYDILYESNQFFAKTDSGANDYLKYFFICSKDNPIHVLNSKGKFHYSYLTKNHLDEVINPISIKIDQFGLNLFCGFTKFFNIFDLITDKLLQKVELKDKNYFAEKSKISCFDFNHYNDFYLVGSYSGKIYLIDYLTNKTFYSIDDKHSNGVNMLKFFNKPENKIFFLSGGRKDNEILLWDTRNLISPIFSFFRESQTNQKLNFEIDKNDDYIYVANNDGSVIVYDLKNLNTVSYFYTSDKNIQGEPVSCLDFNSDYNFLVTANGSRQFDKTNFVGNDSEEDNNLFEDETVLDYNSDRGFKFWHFGNIHDKTNILCKDFV